MGEMHAMKRLFGQFVKFAAVGGIAFCINWSVMNVLLMAHFGSILGVSIGFLVALAYNYSASMSHVFIHRRDMPRWTEMMVFFLNSFIGLGLNDFIVWIFTNVIISSHLSETDHVKYTLFANIGLLVGSAIVAAWSFTVRKVLLDEPKDGNEEKTVLAHKLGTWAKKHTPKGWL